MNQKYISGALLAIVCISTQAGPMPVASNGKDAPERVSISSAGFAKVAANHVTTESARCPGGSYTLRISREQKLVMLVRDDTGKSSDLAATAFGATFLNKNLYGKFFFNCPSAGVGITFFGFEAQVAGPPKPVEYILIIKDNDAVIDSGLLDESYELVNRHLAWPR